MSVLDKTNVLRPRSPGLQGLITDVAFRASPLAFRILRRVSPLPRFGAMTLALLHDDVTEVFATDSVFEAPYREKLQLITGGEPFVLGMNDGQDYRSQLSALQAMVRSEDLAKLAAEVEAGAEAAVSGAGGRIEVVDQLVRRTTFDVLEAYFGVPKPTVGDLQVWATRMFEFQFIDQANSPSLRADVVEMAPALRAHVQGEIDRRKALRRQFAGRADDDVLDRSLTLQAQGTSGFSDAEIRTNLVCLMVGGPPQPAMVVPQALEQLLRRPAALAAAQAAARADDDDQLYAYVLEAMRFDPLAPGLPRRVAQDGVIARGTPRERRVRKGDAVLACFASAMMDDRRLPDPARFDAGRLPYEYIHFGHGLHECFGRHMNRAILHRLLKPLLKRRRLRRSAGAAGRLSKIGLFAQSLVVEYD